MRTATALRLLAGLADRLLAPQPWSFESASYSPRRGGESHTPRPRPDVSASHPGGCKPSLAELVDFYCPPNL